MKSKIRLLQEKIACSSLGGWFLRNFAAPLDPTTLLLAADLLPHLMTFSLLFATVLTFARASQEREITAIRALGISPRVPMVSALLIGLFCSIIATWSHHYATPWAHYHKYRVVADVYRSQIKNILKDQDRIHLPKHGGVMTWQRKELSHCFPHRLLTPRWWFRKCLESTPGLFLPR